MDPSGVATLCNVEQEFLTRKFSLKELKEAVFGMEKNKATRPDDFNIEFYQHFWGMLKVVYLPYWRNL